MNDFIKSFHFHMFDGAAGGGAASSAGEGTGESGSTAEPVVVYGKAEAEDQGEGQVGTDDNTEGNTSEEGNVEDLEAEFNELINGKFKEQFGKHVQNTVQRRFKNSTNFEAQLNAYKEATAPLAAALGVDVGDIDALKNAIEKNDGLYSQLAEEQGMTVEQLRENLQLKADAQKGRAMQQEILKQQQQRETFARWDQEAAELSESFPSFDLAKELQNEAFVENLNRIGDVRNAFMVTHMDEILSGAMESSAKSAKQQTVKNIQQQAARPPENAMSSQPAVIRKDDPSKMTAEERRIVAEKARRGERIVF